MKEFYTFKTSYTVTGTICIDTESEEYNWYMDNYENDPESDRNSYIQKMVDHATLKNSEDAYFGLVTKTIEESRIDVSPVTKDNDKHKVTKTYDAVGRFDHDKIFGLIVDLDEEPDEFKHPNKEFYLSYNNDKDWDYRLASDNVITKYAKLPILTYDIHNKYLYNSNNRQWYVMPYDDVFRLHETTEGIENFYIPSDQEFFNKWTVVHNIETLSKLNRNIDKLEDDELPF